jgi:hypothetical protein
MSQVPVSLEAVGILAGLSPPYSMSQLGGKIVYDSGANQSTVPSVNISLGFFSNKQFTYPVNAIIFRDDVDFSSYPSILPNYVTLTPDGKSITLLAYGSTVYIKSSGGNNSTPYYFNIYMTAFGINSYCAVGNYSSSTITSSNPLKISLYFRNGVPFFVSGGVTYLTHPQIACNQPRSVIATITSSALYSTVVNYVY